MRHGILLSILLLLSYSSFGQSRPDKQLLNYSAENTPLLQVLQEIGEKSKVKIVFTDQSIPDKIITKINVTGREVGQVIGWVITGTKLTYKVIGDQIVVFIDKYAKLNEDFTISGYVNNAATGERLLFANVYLDDLSQGTQTNDYGFFSLKLKPGKYLLKASYLGFENNLIPLELRRDTVLNIEVNPTVELNEIVIVDKKNEKPREIESSTIVPMAFVQSLSSLGGEPDVMRYISQQSGVSSGADGLGGLSVRGGDVSQNLVLLDGVPVYNTGHALGVYSVFNSSTISSAKLIKNGFPARYGGRLSSVMDIRTREGSNRRFQGDFVLSSILAKASLEGPIVKGKSSFLIAARRTLIDPFLKSISKSFYNINNDDGFLNYAFYDFNAKVNFEISDKSKIYFSWFSGTDGYRNNVNKIDRDAINTYRELNETTWDWGNTIASVRYTNQLNKNTFLNLTAYYSKFDFDLFKNKRLDAFLTNETVDTTTFIRASIFSSAIQDIGIKADFEKRQNSSYTIRFGIHGVNHTFSPDQLAVNQNSQVAQSTPQLESSDLKELLNFERLRGNELSLYVENEIKNGKKAAFNLGAHLAWINTDGKSYINLQPRLSSLFFVNKKMRFTSSLSIMSQYLHLLSNGGLGLPNDIWLPTTSIIKPQSSWQFSSGIEADIALATTFKASAYYKALKNIITYGDDGIFSIVNSEDWEENVPVGSGSSIGLEIGIAKNAGKLSGDINYTLSKTVRQFPDIRSGEAYPYRFDRTHALNVNALFRITDRAEFSFNWVYGTGNPFTNATNFFVRVINGNQTLIPEFEPRNSSRFPDYHRLDFGFNLYSSYDWGKQRITIGVYNAYNRDNPFFIDFTRNRDDLSQLVKRNISIFKFIPSFSYSLYFY